MEIGPRQVFVLIACVLFAVGFFGVATGRYSVLCAGLFFFSLAFLFG